MGNKTQPWFGAARRLNERGTDSHGLVVDEAGVTLGPDFPLIRKTSRGYETATLEELSCLGKVVSLSTSDTPRLARHLESIAKALSAGYLAKARILGLYLPINRLTGDQSDRLRKAATLLKGNFNPDEPRDDRGRWTTGAANTQPPSASTGTYPREEAGARRQPATHPGVVRVQDFVIDPEVVPKPLIEEGAKLPWGELQPRIEDAPPPANEEVPPPVKQIPPQAKELPPPVREEPFPPFDLSRRRWHWGPITYNKCMNAAEDFYLWETLCEDLPRNKRNKKDLYRACREVLHGTVEQRQGFCNDLWPRQ